MPCDAQAMEMMVKDARVKKTMIDDEREEGHTEDRGMKVDKGI